MYIQLAVCLIAAIAFYTYQQQISNKCLTTKTAIISFIHFICIILILQSGLRNVAVGADTYEYFRQFDRISSTSWDQIFRNFVRAYETGVGKDPGYGIFMKLITYITTDYQLYLIAVAIIFFSSFGSMLKSFCINVYDVFIAVIIYQALFYGFFSVTGIRQTLAVSILFFACRYIYKKKLLKFIIICLVASTIHKSALIFLPFYFIAHFKHPIKLLTGITLSLPFVFILVKPFAIYMTSFSLTESYSMFTETATDAKGAQMFLVFMLSVTLLIFLCRKYITIESQQYKMGLNAFALGLFFTPLTWVDPNLMRVVMYFSVFSIFILGRLIRTYSYNKKYCIQTISIFLIAAAILSIIKRGYDYAFFWQEMRLPENYNI